MLMAACFLAGSISAQNPNIVNGYYISTKGDSISGQIHIGKISATLGKGFKIEASGDIDLLEVDCTESTYYNWKIQGRPASFKDVTMPTLAELSKHISFKNSPTPFRRFKVRAHQFGAHDYPEVREGFPFRSSELFPVAQSGYFMLEKAFE